MTFPALTAFYGALLALIYLALSGWVVAGRLTTDILHGDSGDRRLLKRIRIHGNFAEYVPFALLLVGLYEAGGGGPATVRALLIVLIVARILHPIGMLAPKNSPQQFACRGGGIIATFGVLGLAAILLLLR
ncbi:MAPEG family protein [Chelatococcus sambhunathii]|uniref:MAPEG family protein n=1 Tax=Chelatococcus sambhunathii TaxID=363953 RepID=A0ABU1DDM0_9HYPH|nr:MAPEG family protein [Chelatococcus sambhunathii]MDR4306213.1 MAPEG family protein [Chelatococcus sambhunathii]